MSILGSIKRIVNAGLARREHLVVHESLVPSPERLVARLRRADLLPKTVIDIGVADGTPWLYAAFPGAKFHLVDPTRESLPHMRRWAEKIDADVHNVALGAQNGSMRVNMRSTIIHATLLKDITEPVIIDSYDVSLHRLDDLFDSVAKPAICKIDVEGSELSVLHGMGNLMDSFDAFIVETSLISLYQDGPEFGDVVNYMNTRNFTLYDICGITRRPFDGALHQVDAVFVPNNSPLRVRRWE